LQILIFFATKNELLFRSEQSFTFTFFPLFKMTSFFLSNCFTLKKLKSVLCLTFLNTLFFPRSGYRENLQLIITFVLCIFLREMLKKGQTFDFTFSPFKLTTNWIKETLPCRQFPVEKKNITSLYANNVNVVSL